jgi:hypothetical protein
MERNDYSNAKARGFTRSNPYGEQWKRDSLAAPANAQDVRSAMQPVLG